MTILDHLREQYAALLEPLTDADRALLSQIDSSEAVRGDDFDLPGSVECSEREQGGSRPLDERLKDDLSGSTGG